MPPLRQTSRSLALLTVLALAASACSNSADAIEQAGDGSYTGGPETSGPNDSGATETGETGDEGDDESGVGIEDPGLELDLCDPGAEQVIDYDLELANAEAAPVLVRERVLFGDGLVPAVPLSPRPFLNHFDFDYEPAEGWELQIQGELWQPAMLNGDTRSSYHLQYAVRAPQMDPAKRLPVDLAIVVDLGAAMTGEPLELAEEALAALEAALLPGDRVTLIGAGAQPTVLGTTLIEGLGITPLTGLIEQLDLAASADLGAALELAYDTVAPSWENQGQQRVLLISNGQFSLEAGLDVLVEDHADEGHYLLTVGVGAPAQFDIAKLSALARDGRGAMLYAHDPDELWLELHDNFTAHLIAAATQLEVRMTLPPGLAIRPLDPDFAGHEPAEPTLAMLSPNEALVFHHELEACGEFSLDQVILVEVEWTDPIAGEAHQAVWEHPVTSVSEGSAMGYKGAATIAYTQALRLFRDGQPGPSHGAVLDAISAISNAMQLLPEDGDLIEMSSVMAQLKG